MLNTKEIDSLNSLIKNWNSSETSSDNEVTTLLQPLMIKFSELENLNSRKGSANSHYIIFP